MRTYRVTVRFDNRAGEQRQASVVVEANNLIEATFRAADKLQLADYGAHNFSMLGSKSFAI